MSRYINYLKIFAYSYLIFLYAPAVLLPIFSFNSSQIVAFPLTGFTTHWFETLMKQETLHEALRNSLIVAVSSNIFDFYTCPVGFTRNYRWRCSFDSAYAIRFITESLECNFGSYTANNAIFNFNNEFSI